MTAALVSDVAVFTALYRANVAAVRLAVRDNVHEPEGVADVVQETFARAFERLPTLRDPAHFRPWLLAIARNAAIDHRRARQRVRVDNGVDVDALVGDWAAPSDVAEVADLAARVQHAVEGLRRRDALAITLVARFGLGPAAVAATLGVSTATAKVVVHRARRRLRDALNVQTVNLMS